MSSSSSAGPGPPEATLPETTQRLFDGYDPATLAEAKSRDFVIERLLEAGDREDLTWMVATFGEPEIRRVLKETRGLSRRSRRFWSLVLEGQLDVEATGHEDLWPL